MLEHLEVAGVKPLGILQMIINDLFYILYIIKLQKELSRSEIVDELKLNPYRFNKL
jgi:hypothetical protein